MNIDLYILAFSAVTVIVTIWMGFRSAKKSKTASDFFVAGRSVSVGWNASAISGEYLSAASFMGIAGMVMSSGYDALWYPVCYACGYLFLLLFIAGPLRRFGAYTIPDFAEGRFDSPLFRKIAVVFVLFIGFFYTMPQMKGAGTTLAYIFPGLPYWAGVVLVGAVITLNVALGGMKGITLVQAFQYWAKMFAISVPIFVLMAVYGHYGKQVGVNGGTPVFDRPVLSSFPNASELYKYVGGEPPEPRWKWWMYDLLGVPRARKLGVSVKTLGSRSGGPKSQLRSVVRYYGAVAHLSVWTVVESDVLDRKVPFSTNLLIGPHFLKEVERAALTQGIIVALRTTNEVWFVSTNLLVGQKHSSRASLPPKAPADSTWLNPFGPLTTKAAKNAAAAIGKKAEQSSRDAGEGSEVREGKITSHPSSSPSLPSSSSREIPLRSDITPDRHLTVALDAPTVAQALGVYAELTGRKLVPNTNSLVERVDDLLNGKLSQLKLITRGATPDSGVRFHHDGMFTAGEVKAAIESQLRAQGIVLRPAGKMGFEAVSVVGDAKSAAASGKSLDVTGKTADVASETSAAAFQSAAGTGKTSAARSNSSAGTFETAAAQSQTTAADHKSSAVAPDSSAVAVTTTAATSKTSVGDSKTTGAVANVPANSVPSTGQSSAATGSRPGTGNSIAQNAEKAWLAKHEKPLALLYTYSLIIAIVCGTAGLPHILVRFYTNPDGAAAKRTTMWVMILIGIFYVFPPVFGVLGRNLMPDLYNGIGAKGTDKIVLELPRVLNAKYPPLGSILSGITCAGAFAAFMSTFSGLLVSMTGALAHDVYGRMLRPKSTPEQRMKMFKIGAVILGGVAIVLGSFVEKLEINFMVGQAFAIAASSYFPLLFMAVWWRQLTMKGAAAGMLGGGLLAMIAISLTSFSTLATGTDTMATMFAMFKPLNAFWAEHPLARILCEQPAIWAVPLAITLMIVVSKLTRREVPKDIRMKMLVLHAPEQLGLKQEYIQEHQAGH